MKGSEFWNRKTHLQTCNMQHFSQPTSMRMFTVTSTGSAALTIWIAVPLNCSRWSRLNTCDQITAIQLQYQNLVDFVPVICNAVCTGQLHPSPNVWRITYSLSVQDSNSSVVWAWFPKQSWCYKNERLISQINDIPRWSVLTPSLYFLKSLLYPVWPAVLLLCLRQD